MHQFVRNLITEWRRLELPFRDETMIVAVSGGADSVSLLLAAHDLIERGKLGHRLVAAHFNHQLRGDESETDEKFVKDLTARLNIELAIGSGQIPAKGNLEQNARDLRYRFLGETAKRLGAYAVLTGHTINDQAETFLMNLLRGSGPDGLAGMSPVRNLEEEKRRIGEKEKGRSENSISQTAPPHFRSSTPFLVRPLLTWAKRIDTEAFCHDLGIGYRYDTMNEDTAFKRVRIRKILLPLLEDFNPRIVETLADTASLMQNLPRPEVAGNQLHTADELDLSTLQDLPKPELFETLRQWLWRQRGTKRQLQLKHIEAIERLIFSSKSGKTVELPGGQIVKTSGKLVYEENKVEN